MPLDRDAEFDAARDALLAGNFSGFHSIRDQVIKTVAFAFMFPCCPIASSAFSGESPLRLVLFASHVCRSACIRKHVCLEGRCCSNSGACPCLVHLYILFGSEGYKHRARQVGANCGGVAHLSDCRRG